MMFEVIKESIASKLKEIFDRVADSFEQRDILTHLNETAAFIQVYEYACKEPCSEGGELKDVYDVTFRVTALSSRAMSAASLCNLVDEIALPTLSTVDLDGLSFERHPVRFSREQGRYELTLDIKGNVISQPYAPSHTVLIDGVQWSSFNNIKVTDSVKMYKLGCASGTVLSGKARNEPKTVTLKAKVSKDEGMSLYGSFAPNKGLPSILVIDGVSFSLMLLSSVTCDMSVNDAWVTLEYTEAVI